MSETKVPALPSPTQNNLLEIAKALKQIVDVREGLIGDPLDANVTFRDLVNAGAVVLNPSFSGRGGNTSPVMPPGSVGGYDPTADLTTPPAPSGLAVTSGMTSIYLEWTGAQFRNPGYTEIWRSETNVLGSAVLIGTTITNLYADAVGRTSKTYYYWIRFVSVANVTGPYNDTAGTIGGTGLIGGTDLSPLIITADKIASGAIDLGGSKITGLLANANMAVITDPTKIADSLIGNAKLADLAVDAAKLANSSVTSTKIANLAVGTAAIQIGAITTALIANAAIGSAQIADAAITSAKIANLAVGNAAIQNAAITNAKIGDMAADKITAGSLTAAIGISTGYVAGGITPGAYAPGSAFFGTGFFLGNYSGTYQFYIGSYSQNLLWNGSSLSVTGNINATSGSFRNITIYDSSNNVILNSGGVNVASVIGLGSLATQNTVSTGQVTGLGSLATQNSVFVGSTVKFADGTTMNTGDFVNKLTKIGTGNISTFIDGLAVTDAYIGNAAIKTAKIDDLAVTGAKIANATIDIAKITNTIQSDNYVADASGWFIRRSDGYAEFGNIKARGDIQANSLTANTVYTENIVGNQVTSTYAGSTTGNVVSATFSVPAGTAAIIILVGVGAGLWTGGGESGYYTPAYGDLEVDGGMVVSASAGSIVWSVANPTAGVHTVTAYRSNYSGVMNMAILVNKR